jgi:hypothetical protein
MDIIIPFISQVLERIMNKKVFPAINIEYVEFIPGDNPYPGINIVIVKEQTMYLERTGNSCRKFMLTCPYIRGNIKHADILFEVVLVGREICKSAYSNAEFLQIGIGLRKQFRRY